MVGSVLGSDPRWDGNRGMGTVALRYSEGKKKIRRKHALPCVFVVFHLHYGKPTMELSWANMQEPSLGSGAMCWGSCLFLPGRFHTLSAGPAAG